MTGTLHATDLLKALLAGIPTGAWIVLAGIVVLSLFKPLFGVRVKGWLGEKAVSHLGLRRLDPAIYRVFDDLYLPRPDRQGTTQIDHVVLSPFGVFVIETKNYRGWIFGSADRRRWTQSLPGGVKRQFQNPGHQNELHVRALQRHLELERNRFHSIVFFVGDSTFKTEVPPNVLDRGLRTYIEGHRVRLLGPGEVERCAALLAELQSPGHCSARARAHRRSVRRWR